MQKPDTVFQLRSHQCWAHQNNLLHCLIHDLPANLSPNPHYFTFVRLLYYWLIFILLSRIRSRFLLLYNWQMAIPRFVSVWFLLRKCWFSGPINLIYPADCGPWFQFVKIVLPFTVLALSCSLLLLINFVSTFSFPLSKCLIIILNRNDLRTDFAGT